MVGGGYKKKLKCLTQADPEILMVEWPPKHCIYSMHCVEDITCYRIVLLPRNALPTFLSSTHAHHFWQIAYAKFHLIGGTCTQLDYIFPNLLIWRPYSHLYSNIHVPGYITEM